MRRAKRLCAFPGCKEITEGKYCPVHQKQMDREADSRRENAVRRGYDYQWSKFRNAYLKRPENQFCVLHIAKNCRIKADCIDHIVPLELGGSKYDESNLQPSCTPCNVLKGRNIFRGVWVFGSDPLEQCKAERTGPD